MGQGWQTTFKRWVSGKNNWGPQQCFFNSALTKDGVTTAKNASLTIYLRLHLVERNKKDLHMVRHTPHTADLIRDWEDGEFRKFKTAVQQKGGEFWNNRFCLLNHLDVTTFDVRSGSDLVRPNIDCGFEVVWAESSADAHQTINCFCPNAGKSFTSFVQGSDEGMGVGQFTHKDIDMGEGLIMDAATCTRDVGDPLGPDPLKTETYSCPKQVDHLTVAHELGHLIGLPHVGLARRNLQCIKAMDSDPVDGVNHSSCYVGPTHVDTENIMGKGNLLAPWNAMPWLIRLFLHTNIGPHAWKVTNRHVPPKVV